MSTDHNISIGVARSDEPDDAYFWRCVCGKSGPLRRFAQVALPKAQERLGLARRLAGGR